MTEITERLSTALADRYRIESHLGEGGMATVYLAWGSGGRRFGLGSPETLAGSEPTNHSSLACHGFRRLVAVVVLGLACDVPTGKGKK